MSAAATAQESTAPRFGASGLVALNDHDADFLRIPGTASCCLGFTGGSGTGFGGGVLAELPLGDLFMIGGRLSLLTHPFSMRTPETTFVIVDGVGQEGTFEHRLDGSSMTLGLEPTFIVRPFGDLLIALGARVALPLSSDYEQSEVIIQPESSGTFVNGDGTDSQSRTRNRFDGPLPDAAMQISPLLSLSYELPMNAQGTMILAPEIGYQMGVTDVVDGIDWKTSVIRAGVAVKFTSAGSREPEKEERRDRREIVDTVRVEVPILAQTYARGRETRSEMVNEIDDAIVTTETIRRTDTLFAQKTSEPVVENPTSSSELTATIAAVGVTEEGIEEPLLRLRVEEFSSTLMTPLLNYVFFEENSSTIPERYNDLAPGAITGFDIDAVNSPDRLPTYHHLLNIVGRRMHDNPTATITLTGCNQDIREEKGNRALSRARADAVKSYLVDVCRIDPTRIAVEARDLPAKAANTTTADGSQENRRVEIVSNDRRILAPVITRDTLRRTNPPVVRFRTTVAASAGIEEWVMTAGDGATVTKEFDGVSAVPTTIDWNIGRDNAAIPRTGGAMTYTLNVDDREGRTATASGSIPVEVVTIRQKRMERRDDMEIDRFSLILFEVRSSDLTAQQEPIIDLITEYIRPTSTVRVIGFTDRLGDEAYNQTLASNRATTVASALGNATSDVRGIGEADLFDEELPEGRLYTRTVEVVIETPIAE